MTVITQHGYRVTLKCSPLNRFYKNTKRSNLHLSITLSMGTIFQDCYFMYDSFSETSLCSIFNNYPLQIGNETELLDKKVKQILMIQKT